MNHTRRSRAGCGAASRIIDPIGLPTTRIPRCSPGSSARYPVQQMNASRPLKHSLAVLSLLIAGAAHAAHEDTAPLPAPAQPRADGSGLVIPDGLAERGTLYHLLHSRAVQATFRSTTPLETFAGETDAILGYALLAHAPDIAAAFATPEESVEAEPPAAERRGVLLAAEFVVPVDSIRTGIDMRDRHLQSSEWLDASNHPHIRYRLAFFADPNDITPDTAPDGAHTIRGELVGDMTIRGITRPIRITAATIALLPQSDTTARVAPGDLMALRCRYTLTLEDFGIRHAIIGRQVARTIEVDQVLYFSTEPPAAPDQSPSPESDDPSAETSDSGAEPDPESIEDR